MKYIANPVVVDAFKIKYMQPKFDGGIPLILDNDIQVIATNEMISRMIPCVGDYWVIQSDGYTYLNPAEVFERKYSPMEKE